MKDKPESKPIDDYLKQKILERVGYDKGNVTITNQEWDLGMCETCSWPQTGFAVYVDNELVWPNDEYLSEFGGYIYADDSGAVKGGELSTYGYFFDWLAGKDLQKLAHEEDDV